MSARDCIWCDDEDSHGPCPKHLVEAAENRARQFQWDAEKTLPLLQAERDKVAAELKDARGRLAALRKYMKSDMDVRSREYQAVDWFTDLRNKKWKGDK